MKRNMVACIFSLLLVLIGSAPTVISAQTKRVINLYLTNTPTPQATASSAIIELTDPTPIIIQSNITKESQEFSQPLLKLMQNQKLGPILPFNLIKYALRNAVAAGVPVNTIVLLLLLPAVAALIAATRHLVGLRGFGIFLPAALSVVFVAIGPLVGIGLFMVIVIVSTFTRIVMRKIKLNLQYLPRMALMLLLVVMGILTVLFLAPVIPFKEITNVSIFPVLILVLLAEDFSKVQLGKSFKVALNLSAETLILSFISYIFLTTKAVQEVALLRPEIWVLSIVIFDILLGKYVGLRLMEIWRFRKLINS